MSVNWRETVLKHMTSGTARVRVVADPDGLLLDEDLLHQLELLGFSVLLYDDPWAFRVRYEEDFRALWDHGRVTNRLLVRSVSTNLDHVPFDVLDPEDPVYVSVGQLFSHLDHGIMADIDRRLYDRAFRVNRAVGSGRLNHQTTALRLLHDLYFVDPDLVTSQEDVWALISQVHRLGYPLAYSLAEVLSNTLRQWHPALPVPMCDALVSRRTWEAVLRQALKNGEMMVGARYWLGLLGWDSEIGDQFTHVSSVLIRKLRQFLDQSAIVGRDWLQQAEDIATLRMADHMGLEGVDTQLLQDVDYRFEEWVHRDYGLLQSLPPYPDPVMLHQVVHYMARQKDIAKWALLVVDGMSYADWLYIRSFLDLSAYQVTERAVFAWVPTITSVSRKAIFSGRVPRDYGQSLGTTTGEDNLWQQFWARQHRNPGAIQFQKTADQISPERLLDSVNDGYCEIVGLVANTVDMSAHSATMGIKQLLQNIRFWIEDGQWLPKVIQGMADQGFQVVITSDHGHMPVEGIGRPPTGDIPDSKGQRVQVFSSKALRDQVAAEWGTPWEHLSGLPTDYVPLLAPSHRAYASPGKRILSHGGVSMEELVVPMIRITR